MFSLQLQDSGNYKVYLPDDSKIVLEKGVEDTHALRRELAKLSHRIAAREHLKTSKEYIPNFWEKDLSVQDSHNLIEMFSYIDFDQVEWVLLDEYQEPIHEEIACMERELVIEKQHLDKLIKARAPKLKCRSKRNEDQESTGS